LPAIEQKTTLKSISFEIPLDESMICKTINQTLREVYQSYTYLKMKLKERLEM